MEEPGPVTYRRPEACDYDAIASLIRAEWPHKPADAERVGAWVSRSSTALVAEADGLVVGFVRVISDEISSAYIPMLVVHESRRRQGIGRQLVVRATGGFSNSEITWVLRARAGSEPFWATLGFSISSRAMERVRTRG
jgi:ribosomal protein S18 acetylase RimI-like enzyme